MLPERSGGSAKGCSRSANQRGLAHVSSNTDLVVWADREHVGKRLHALVDDFLDSQGASADRELVDVGVFAIVVELRERSTPGEIHDLLEARTRPEVGYTPEAEWRESTWYRCSDRREWIASGLFRRAMLIADGYYDDPEDDEDTD